MSESAGHHSSNNAEATDDDALQARLDRLRKLG